MNQERYDLTNDDDSHTFKFISEGPRGKIYKMVIFKPLADLNGFYNLCLGDWNEATEKLDDSVVSNNRDTPKVLATVAFAIHTFLTAHPNAVILASGSNAARNRLYRMSIQRYMDEIRNRLVIRGRVDKKWQPFKKGGNYEVFTLFSK